jgi:hypothetical protein
MCSILAFRPPGSNGTGTYAKPVIGSAGGAPLSYRGAPGGGSRLSSRAARRARKAGAARPGRRLSVLPMISSNVGVGAGGRLGHESGGVEGLQVAADQGGSKHVGDSRNRAAASNTVVAVAHLLSRQGGFARRSQVYGPPGSKGGLGDAGDRQVVRPRRPFRRPDEGAGRAAAERLAARRPRPAER